MPPPPPSQPAPVGGTPSTAGSNKKTYTILAYVLGWLGGLIFLFVGKDDPDVKWNAANSLLIFGGLSVVMIVLSFIPPVFFLVYVLWLVGLVYWVIFLVKALQGNGERIPAPGISNFLSPYVDQVANAVK
ncbi:MAG: hypothetical protein E6I12_11635 [Chloroflexi bacterium]|nr:MAG: hypothetical protein AUI15_09115 [Actinobacteria bacterium 13_2_20CM_2_66_6]TMB78723.1 MAG: hypothetical protein E6J46_05280 [Chloroflexota bacterium]TMF75532.1 MAG: hypothetical protein E6I12_11635 [Chloroflexota bacterium]TMF76065.1 MAG: hypothetical protein E6I15_07720 [Chloroflexota bacterium]TMF92129.1 MAG: hypothetical protein E6I05_11330 [Chloroflexota bacterium]